MLVFGVSVLGAFGGALLERGRQQRAVDLAAISGARSMRDDFERLFEPPRDALGSPNPHHLEKGAYLEQARLAALEIAAANGVEARSVSVVFPDGRSFAPLHIRVTLRGSGAAEAALDPPSPTAVATPAAQPAVASGGGYTGPLSYRQGKPMRPDVAIAFDRLESAALRAGVRLIITSAYRSDAEQARLYARHPDPRWVAPPGKSLHRNGTELDLGPAAAYGWLRGERATVRLPPAVLVGAVALRLHRRFDRATGRSGALAPRTVAERCRLSFHRATRPRSPRLRRRWNVSAELLAAQLFAESNFNPFARSPAGALGIAQFMPGDSAQLRACTTRSTPRRRSTHRRHLMHDLLRRFGVDRACARRLQRRARSRHAVRRHPALSRDARLRREDTRPDGRRRSAPSSATQARGQTYLMTVNILTVWLRRRTSSPNSAVRCPIRPASTSSRTPAAACSTSARPSRSASGSPRISVAAARRSAGRPRFEDRIDRLRRHRERGRGAARRAELHQAAPAGFQHPPAGRQVLPVHRHLARRGVPARLLHTRAPPSRRAPTSAPSRAPSACARRSTCSASSSPTEPARGRSPAARPATPASTTT